MTSPQTTRQFGANNAVLLGLIALAIAFGINAIFHSESLFVIAGQGAPILQQLGIGLIVGSVLAVLGLAALATGSRYFKNLEAFKAQMFALFDRVNLVGVNPLVIGITAGVWEETLFRAALQPVIGIWWTSLIFVLCHTGTGQFWTMNWKKAMYAAGAFAASVMLGLIFEHVGLLAAITVHAVIDVIGLYAMRYLRTTTVVVSQNA